MIGSKVANSWPRTPRRRKLQRWRGQVGPAAGEGGALRSTPSHSLSLAVCAAPLDMVNEPRFASVPLAHILPMLADACNFHLSGSSVDV